MNRLDEPVFMAVPKSMLTEFGIHYRFGELCLLHNMGNLIALDIYSLGTPDTSLSGLSTLKALRALASTPSTSRLDISMSKKPITIRVKNLSTVCRDFYF